MHLWTFLSEMNINISAILLRASWEILPNIFKNLRRRQTRIFSRTFFLGINSANLEIQISIKIFSRISNEKSCTMIQDRLKKQMVTGCEKLVTDSEKSWNFICSCTLYRCTCSVQVAAVYTIRTTENHMWKFWLNHTCFLY